MRQLKKLKALNPKKSGNNSISFFRTENLSFCVSIEAEFVNLYEETDKLRKTFDQSPQCHGNLHFGMQKTQIPGHVEGREQLSHPETSPNFSAAANIWQKVLSA